MKCQNCGKRDVAFKFTRVGAKGVPADLHLCPNCAAEKSPYVAKFLQRAADASGLLEELLKNALGEAAATPESDPAPPPATPAVHCTHCSLSFAQYKSSAMVGCPDCYESFGDLILEDIRSYQGTDSHTGLVSPERSLAMDPKARLEAMRAELLDCIENEDFDRAAYLRDEIRKLSGELHRPAAGAGSEDVKP